MAFKAPYYFSLQYFSSFKHEVVTAIFVGSMDRESSQQLHMWFSEHFFAPKLAA